MDLMKQRRLVIAGALISMSLISLFIYTNQKPKQEVGYYNYISQLNQTYQTSEEIEELFEQIPLEYSFNHKEALKFEVLKLYYHYLTFNYETIKVESKDILKQLKEFNLDNEVLYVYMMLTSVYLSESNFTKSYLYLLEAENLVSKLEERYENNERMLTELNTNFILIKYLEVRLTIGLGDTELGEKQFKEAEKLRSELLICNQADIDYNILAYYNAMKDYEMVEAYAEKMDSYPKTDFYLNRKLGSQILYVDSLIESNQTDKALKVITNLEKYQAQTPEVFDNRLHLLKGKLYAQRNELDKAIEELELAHLAFYNDTNHLDVKLEALNLLMMCYKQRNVVPDDFYQEYTMLMKQILDSTKNYDIIEDYIENELEHEQSKVSVLAFQGVCLVLILIGTIVFFTFRQYATWKRSCLDGLTAAYNRASFNADYHKLIKSKNKKAYITLIDCDNFKQINDTYGHLFGDEVLIEISQNILNQLDQSSALYRYGGEEFIIISKNETDASIHLKMDEIRKSTMDIPLSESIKPTISIGIASVKLYNEDVIKQADLNLYESKQTGKNKITLK